MKLPCGRGASLSRQICMLCYTEKAPNAICMQCRYFNPDEASTHMLTSNIAINPHCQSAVPDDRWSKAGTARQGQSLRMDRRASKPVLGVCTVNARRVHESIQCSACHIVLWTRICTRPFRNISLPSASRVDMLGSAHHRDMLARPHNTRSAQHLAMQHAHIKVTQRQSLDHSRRCSGHGNTNRIKNHFCTQAMPVCGWLCGRIMASSGTPSTFTRLQSHTLSSFNLSSVRGSTAAILVNHGLGRSAAVWCKHHQMCEAAPRNGHSFSLLLLNQPWRSHHGVIVRSARPPRALPRPRLLCCRRREPPPARGLVMHGREPPAASRHSRMRRVCPRHRAHHRQREVFIRLWYAARAGAVAARGGRDRAGDARAAPGHGCVHRRHRALYARAPPGSRHHPAAGVPIPCHKRRIGPRLREHAGAIFRQMAGAAPSRAVQKGVLGELPLDVALCHRRGLQRRVADGGAAERGAARRCPHAAVPRYQVLAGQHGRLAQHRHGAVAATRLAVVQRRERCHVRHRPRPPGVRHETPLVRRVRLGAAGRLAICRARRPRNAVGDAPQRLRAAAVVRERVNHTGAHRRRSPAVCR